MVVDWTRCVVRASASIYFAYFALDVGIPTMATMVVGLISRKPPTMTNLFSLVSGAAVFVPHTRVSPGHFLGGMALKHAYFRARPGKRNLPSKPSSPNVVGGIYFVYPHRRRTRVGQLSTKFFGTKRVSRF